MFVAFVLGFAAGCLALSLWLWQAGPLRAVLGRNVMRATTTIVSPKMALAGVPDPSLANQIPNPEPGALPPVTGESDRMMTPDKIAMPLAGVDPRQLTDTFYQKRDGHAHEALDIPAPRGTPVRAAVEGNVAKLFTSKQGGLTVYQFDNAGKFAYYYAHLDRYAPGIREGVLLRQGDVLGYVGSTGDASPNAPHLHFAVFRLGPEKKWWQGTAVDPLPLLQ
jgi:murein DD-endopeptidase MepM/ murein hydrolase activator NlpD